MTPPQAPVLTDLTVMIPTIGRPMLRGCLRSIAAGGALPGQLVIVDQGGRRETDAWVKEFPMPGTEVHHVRSDRRGVAAARNDGLDRVETQYVAVTDDDCRVEPDWLERMQARLRQNAETIITGRVQPEGEQPVPGTITDPEPAFYKRPLLDRDPLFPDNMGLPIALARRIGPFDEDKRLRYAEDNDWSYRALKAGITIAYAPEVVVTHLGWRDADQRAATYRNYARSQGGFYAKHLRRGDWFIAMRTLFDLARGPWMWIRGTVQRNEDLAAYGRAYMRDLPTGLGAGLRRGS